jgi:trans-2,3-dihydro-3-hydroxyanthranilate isomerase
MTRYHHVDVFSDAAYTGNSLAVFVDPPPLSAGQMLRVTQELRHFETIFVTTLTEPGTVQGRVFDLFGELDFAGHPVLGAAAVLHELLGTGANGEWTFQLPARTVRVATRRGAGYVAGVLDQGRPELIVPAAPLDRELIAASVGLAGADLDPGLPPEIVSTGLRYLIVPVRAGALVRARIARPDFGEFLAQRGAEFAYLLDAAAMEGRHWTTTGYSKTSRPAAPPAAWPGICCDTSGSGTASRPHWPRDVSPAGQAGSPSPPTACPMRSAG